MLTQSPRSAHLCCCWSTAHQHCSSSLLLVIGMLISLLINTTTHESLVNLCSLTSAHQPLLNNLLLVNLCSPFLSSLWLSTVRHVLYPLTACFLQHNLLMLKNATTICVLHASSAFSIHHQKVISDHTFQTLCISLVYSYTHITVYTPLYVHHCIHIHHLISECQDSHLGVVCVYRRPQARPKIGLLWTSIWHQWGLFIWPQTSLWKNPNC